MLAFARLSFGGHHRHDVGQTAKKQAAPIPASGETKIAVAQTTPRIVAWRQSGPCATGARRDAVITTPYEATVAAHDPTTGERALSTPQKRPTKQHRKSGVTHACKASLARLYAPGLTCGILHISQGSLSRSIVRSVGHSVNRSFDRVGRSIDRSVGRQVRGSIKRTASRSADQPSGRSD